MASPLFKFSFFPPDDRNTDDEGIGCDDDDVRDAGGGKSKEIMEVKLNVQFMFFFLECPRTMNDRPCVCYLQRILEPINLIVMLLANLVFVQLF